MLLGGVEVASDMHLAAHSDGDAVAHAVTDAILGAAAVGDIGSMFPDTDSANKGRDSMEMLAAAVGRLRAIGFAVSNVDVTVVTEKPKIAQYRERMRESLATTLGVDAAAVGLKGKTNEGMGWIGRGEGLACMAVATIVSIDDAGAD